ncbi:RES family NAD+ phosphorylase [Elizabethkingia anophelis]|nr:RES family NAD+ phosphorylase [Elizabethkingia anophelis]
MKTIACSGCFEDEGLVLTCKRYGDKTKHVCPHCSKIDGHKLSREKLVSACEEYFICGSFWKARFGGDSQININQYQKTNVDFIKYLKNDIALIESILGCGFFYTAPQMHNLGFTNYFEKLTSRSIKKQDEVLEEIINRYPSKKINDKHHFYRLRVNPKFCYDTSQYDSPPISVSGKGRLDTKKLNILYGSPNIEVCLHECRATLIDSLYIAKMVPCVELKLLNLSSKINDKRIGFDNLSIFINQIFTSEKQSYKFCRKIASYVYSKGYDGIIYPSYFNQVKSKRIINYAIFGSPVSAGKVTVEGINRLIINRVDYKHGFGPVII